MKIGSVLQLKLIREYNNSKTNTTLAAPGGDKAQGKSYDRIAAGVTSPYKNIKHITEKEKEYPALSKIVQKLKDSQNLLQGDIIITGPAFNELNRLLVSSKPKKDENGYIKLPFGDNIVLKQQGQNYFMGYSEIPQDAGKNLTPESNV